MIHRSLWNLVDRDGVRVSHLQLNMVLVLGGFSDCFEATVHKDSNKTVLKLCCYVSIQRKHWSEFQ